MPDETPDPQTDPVSGLPSITVGHRVTSGEVGEALDDETDGFVSPATAEALNADESTQAAVAPGPRMLGALDEG